MILFFLFPRNNRRLRHRIIQLPTLFLDCFIANRTRNSLNRRNVSKRSWNALLFGFSINPPPAFGIEIQHASLEISDAGTACALRESSVVTASITVTIDLMSRTAKREVLSFPHFSLCRVLATNSKIKRFPSVTNSGDNY